MYEFNLEKTIKTAQFDQTYFGPATKTIPMFVKNQIELTEGSKERAINYLEKAAGNKYGINSETYMWHVARIHYQNLLNKNH